jgi:hypothetical protein
MAGIVRYTAGDLHIKVTVNTVDITEGSVVNSRNETRSCRGYRMGHEMESAGVGRKELQVNKWAEIIRENTMVITFFGGLGVLLTLTFVLNYALTVNGTTAARVSSINLDLVTGVRSYVFSSLEDDQTFRLETPNVLQKGTDVTVEWERIFGVVYVKRVTVKQP